jgi:hypothetical protein
LGREVERLRAGEEMDHNADEEWVIATERVYEMSAPARRV